MLLRALLAFLLLPGMVAFALPVTWLASQGASMLQPWGLVPLGIGATGLLACVIEFYRRGHGTLAPWSPPETLVVTGLYRVSRNPMYVCVLLILIGWAWAFESAPLLAYAGCVALGFHLRVVIGEEPWLARRHGQGWTNYAGRVRRWL
ncbi:MAG: isoprenylcysteine carboxylmethyltransferase family protein [Paucibacter sp.]|nr:isoprenylcysteine carboxylmethyltransferase family protein [Roseateles sp.]